MSKYLNNPSIVCPLEVPVGSNNELINKSLIEVVREVVGKPEIWSKDDGVITIKALCGGITNALYLIETVHENTSVGVIVRLFGHGTDVIIDRDTENVIFAALSVLENISVPTFFGLFKNGRVEGYIPNTKTLSPPDLSDLMYLHLNAETVAVFHQISLNVIKHDIVLWPKIDNFMSICISAKFSDSDKQNIYDGLNIGSLKQEYEKLRVYLSQEPVLELGSFVSLGRRFASEKVLGHNDLLSGNILYSLTPQDSSAISNGITLIDYEYCGYNYRGYDIANHFCEFCGFDFNIRDNFPSENVRRSFLRKYVITTLRNHAKDKICSPSLLLAVENGLNASEYDSVKFNEFIDGFDERVREFTAASHFFWGSWSVVQANMSQIDFDYIGYAKLRFDGYYYHKQLFKYNW